jgi:ribosomal protein S18 acetylase RimI-like enzyme
VTWFSIRRLNLDDIEFAIQITRPENWGYSKNDFTSMLEEHLGNHFIAQESEEKRKIGMISTYDYGGKLGWIGNVVVLKEFRQRGVATALVEYGMEYFRTRGIKTVRLYSYSHSESLYERLGFIREGTFGLFTATPSLNTPRIERREGGKKANLLTVNKVRMRKLIELDEKCFGANRKKMLTSMIQDKKATCFIKVGGTEKGRINGYVVASKSKDECEIGPMVCDPNQEGVARELVEAVLDHFSAKKFSLATSMDNSSSVKVLRHLGFKKTIQVQKMRKGRNLYNGKPTWIFGVAGLEKG